MGKFKIPLLSIFLIFFTSGCLQEALGLIILDAGSQPNLGSPKIPLMVVSAVVPPKSSDNWSEIKVLFATDRLRNPNSNQIFYDERKELSFWGNFSRFFEKEIPLYGSERGELTYGICTVTIPFSPKHTIGNIETPTVKELEFSEDPEKHIVLKAIKQLDYNEFINDFNDKIDCQSTQLNAEKSALVFIHGYNVTFNDAAIRTAQLYYDLNYKGVPILYSWPSYGETLAYTKDEANVDWTSHDLLLFLNDIADKTNTDRIYLFAHSMGSRALTKALTTLFCKRTDIRHKFKEVILAAPDIDADIFKREIIPAISKASSDESPEITLYACSEDVALKASKKLHAYPRAGDAGNKGEALVVSKDIETIDATWVDTSFLSHSYYATSRPVLGDISELINKDIRADQRSSNLRAKKTITGDKYWEFNK